MQRHHPLRQRRCEVQAPRHYAAQIGRGVPAVGAEDRPGNIHRAAGAKVMERDPRVAGFAARRRPTGPRRAAPWLASRRRERRVQAEVPSQRLRAGRPDRLPRPRYRQGHVPNLRSREEGAPRTEIPGKLALVVAAHTQHVVESRAGAAGRARPRRPHCRRRPARRPAGRNHGASLPSFREAPPVPAGPPWRTRQCAAPGSPRQRSARASRSPPASYARRARSRGYRRRARGRVRRSVAVLCRIATSGTTTASRHHASRSMMNS